MCTSFSTNKTNIAENVEILVPSEELFQRKQPELYVLKQLRIALCLTIGNLTVGYTTGWATSIIPKLKDPLQTSLTYLILDKDGYTMIRVMVFGAVLGSLISGFTANRVGRKPCLIFTSSLNILGYSIMANAVDVTTMSVGRFIAGMAAGSIAVVNVVYLGEIASPEIRGAILAMGGIMHVFGSLLVCSLGPYVCVEVVCYVCVGVGCVHVCVLCYVPESPVYQVMKGKHNEARLTLHDLGKTGNIDEELNLICKLSEEALIPKTRDDRGLVKRLLLKLERKNIRGFFITTVLLCLQAGGGRVAVVYFATHIFKSSWSSVDPDVGNVVLGLTELCGVIMTPMLVERCGRRIMLLLSLGFCCLITTVLGTYFYLEVNNFMIIKSMKWLPIFLLMLFLFSYNFGIGIVPNILSSEMFSAPFRSTCCSISMSLAWIVLLYSCNIESIITAIFTDGRFFICAGANAMGLLFVIFVVPETTGRNLKEIGNLLQRHNLY